MSDSAINSAKVGIIFGECTFIILAGGWSTRFGEDKANACWGGRKMINHLASRLAGLGFETLAVSRGEQATQGWEVDRIVHDDPAAPAGPLRGIVRGLECCLTPWAFILSCDAPLIQPELLMDLCRVATPDCAAVLPLWKGCRQPLIALYQTSYLGRFRLMLQAGERSPLRALNQVPHVDLPEARCRTLDPRGLSFLNVNTREVLESMNFRGISAL